MQYLLFYDNLLKNADQKQYTCSIFLDLSKVFDTANHQILTDKLHNKFGIRGIVLDLIKS